MATCKSRNEWNEGNDGNEGTQGGNAGTAINWQQLTELY